jgi:hypothetical protein
MVSSCVVGILTTIAGLSLPSEARSLGVLSTSYVTGDARTAPPGGVILAQATWPYYPGQGQPQPYSGQQPYYRPPNNGQQTQPRPQSPQGAQAEQAFRNSLTQQGIAGGFGGIFGPGLRKWLNTPSAPSSGGGGECAHYNDYAAQQACKSGHGWAADRLENKQSDGAERDWYNR